MESRQDRICRVGLREHHTPNLQRINKSLGQDNDAKFLAYMIEYVMMKCSGG
jgi:hypothetical protein